MINRNESSRRHFVARAASTAALAALPAQRANGEEFTSALTPYLLFDGTCSQAMRFYESCFGGELTLMKVKDSPAKDLLPAVQREKVLNARLKSAKLEISASDWLLADRKPARGNMVCLYLSGAARDIKILFERLSEGAEVTDPLAEQFFGAYGALNDKFGVRWMFHADKEA